MTIQLAGASGTFTDDVATLIDGHRSGAYELPESVIKAVEAADFLNTAAAERGREHRRREEGSGERENAAKALLRDSAARQVLDEDALVALRADRAETARLLEDSAFLGEAARSATRVVEGLIYTEADDLGRALKDGLAAVLTAARPHVVGSINLGRLWDDPIGVKRARALDELVPRHQAIRKAAVAHHRLNPEWQGIVDFAGPGSGLRPPEKVARRGTGDELYRYVNPGSASEAIERLREAAAAAVRPQPRKSAVARDARAPA